MRDLGAGQKIEERGNSLSSQARAEHGWLEQLLDILPVGVMITDAGGRCLMTNPEADRINRHKFPPNSSIEDYVEWRLLYWDGRPVEHKDFPLMRVLQKGETVRGEEQRILYDDGTTLPISVTAVPVYDEQGRIVNAVAVLKDLTDRVRCEDELFGLTYENRWK
jgi:PAS domain-containing protein